MRFLFLAFLLVSCSLPRKANVEEMIKVKNLISEARNKIVAGELDEAESLIMLANEINSMDPMVIDAYGCLAWHRKDDVLAETLFKQAISVDPSFENSYVNLAFIYETKGELLKARELLKKALKINPLNYKARNNYAAMLIGTEFGKKEFTKAINTAPRMDSVLEYNKVQFQVE